MRRYIAVVAMAVVTGSCSSSTEKSGPTPGTGEIRVTSVPAGTGAIVFTIQGGSMSQLTARSGYTPYQRALSTTSTRVALVASSVVATEVVLSFTVPDVSNSSTYQVVSEGGATNNTYALVAASQVGLSLTFPRGAP